MSHGIRRKLPGLLLLLALMAVCKFGDRLWSGSHPRLIQQMLDESPALIAQLPEKAYPAEMEHWFKAITKAGYTREARQIAATIRTPMTRSQALGAVAIGLFEAQRLDEAAELARSISDAKVRDETLRIVSLGFAVTGRMKGQPLVPVIFPARPDGMKSVSTASDVKDASQRDSGLVDSSRVLRIMNDDASAEAAGRRIADASARDEAQAAKAWALALKGQPDTAIEAAAAVVNATRRNQALATIAGVLADRGREAAEPLVIAGQVIERRTLSEGAIRAAERAVAEARRARVDPSVAQGALAEVLGKTRRFDEACVAAAAIDDKIQRIPVQARLVQSLAEGGEPARAMQLARTMTEPRERSDALTSLLEVAAKSATTVHDDVITGAAEAIFAAARENAESADRSEGLQHASQALAALGRRSEALRAATEALAAARQVTEPEARAYALSHAAEAWARAEPGPKAVACAREALVAAAPFGSPYSEGGPLHHAAGALIQAWSPKKAVELVTALEDPIVRALALMALADIVGGYGWDGEIDLATIAARRALEAAQAIPDIESRASVVTAAMEIAGRAGLVDSALAAAESIPGTQTARRSEAFQTLASLEADHGRFDRALTIARLCSPSQRLAVFGTIVDVYATKPEMRRFARAAKGDQGQAAAP
ncbi:MAG: hypothetical protein P4L84_22390 [Isosphaeraceae bacterium]|nr:hypothetical protein [Isosphaeraceae bacterium]